MPEKVKPDEVKLARQVIGTFEGDVDFESYRDDYQVGLREIIDAKIEGREIVAPEVEAPPKVVNLMEALRKSLDTISVNKKKAPDGVTMAARGRARQEARGRTGISRSLSALAGLGVSRLAGSGYEETRSRYASHWVRNHRRFVLAAADARRRRAA